jgi:hypothetical protein
LKKGRGKERQGQERGNMVGKGEDLGGDGLREGREERKKKVNFRERKGVLKEKGTDNGIYEEKKIRLRHK